MNKERRAEIDRIAKLIRSVSEDLQVVMDEEQEYYDNMPESLQSGEKGGAAEAALAELEQAINYCDEIDGFLESAKA